MSRLPRGTGALPKCPALQECRVAVFPPRRCRLTSQHVSRVSHHPGAEARVVSVAALHRYLCGIKPTAPFVGRPCFPAWGLSWACAVSSEEGVRAGSWGIGPVTEVPAGPAAAHPADSARPARAPQNPGAAREPGVSADASRGLGTGGRAPPLGGRLWAHVFGTGWSWQTRPASKRDGMSWAGGSGGVRVALVELASRLERPGTVPAVLRAGRRPLDQQQRLLGSSLGGPRGRSSSGGVGEKPPPRCCLPVCTQQLWACLTCWTGPPYGASKNWGPVLWALSLPRATLPAGQHQSHQEAQPCLCSCRCHQALGEARPVDLGPQPAGTAVSHTRPPLSRPLSQCPTHSASAAPAGLANDSVRWIG